MEFSAETQVDPLRVVQLVQGQPATYRLDGATQLRFTRELPTFEDRMGFALELLDLLTPEEEMQKVAQA